MVGRLEPRGFWSYTKSDDESTDGHLSQVRARVAKALQLRVGRPVVSIFQDKEAIPLGTEWEKRIYQALSPHFSHALRRLHHRKRFHYLIKLTWQMASNLPDFERTSPAPPVGGVGGVGMWPCGVWFVGLRRRRGAARHAPGQTRADRDRPRRWRRGSGAR